MPLQAALQLFRSPVILLRKRFAHGRQRLHTLPRKAKLYHIRMLRALVRLAAPKCDVVEREPLLSGRRSIYHCADASVANWQRFLKELRRTVIVQGQSAFVNRGAGAQRHHRQA